MKKILIIAIIALALLVASGMAQPTQLTQSVTQNAEGFGAATVQTAENVGTVNSPGAAVAVNQQQVVTQNAGTGVPGTATVTQNAQNRQPGLSNGAAGSALSATITQTAVTTAGGAINQRARNNDLTLNSLSANQVVSQVLTQTATAGPGTNINQGGWGGGVNPATNSARNNGANGVIQQVLTQTANGGNNVAQRADNRGPPGVNQPTPFGFVLFNVNGARTNGNTQQTITQNAGQTTPASGGVTQLGENNARPIGGGAAATQTITQAGTTVGTGFGAGVTQGANNLASGNTGGNTNNNQNFQQAITQMGTAAGGAAANVVNQRGYNAAQAIGANANIVQTITATGTGTTVNQGTPPIGGITTNMRNFGRVLARGAAPSANVQQTITLNAFGTGAVPGALQQFASQESWNVWAAGVPGTLQQLIEMNANPGFAGITQNGLNN